MERRGRLFLSVDRVKNPNFFGVSDFFRSSGVFLDINLFFFFFFLFGQLLDCKAHVLDFGRNISS